MGSLPAGWHLNEAGLAKASGAASAEGGGQGKDKWLLDIDLREDGEAVLPKQFDSLKTPGVFQPALDCIFNKAKSEAAPAQDEGLVLQVKSVRNVSAPKANEESGAAPRMLKISLTDGHTTIHGLEVTKLEGVSINSAPPGSKVRLKGKIPLSSTGFMMLETGTVKCLGGKVEGLTDKWEENRKLAHFTRAKGRGGGGLAVSGSEGPPAWVPFGKKIKGGDLQSDQQQSQANGDKKAPNQHTKQQSPAADGEGEDPDGDVGDGFDSQRQDAIKELSTGSKKVFGGGTKEIKEGSSKGRGRRDRTQPQSVTPGDAPGPDSVETKVEAGAGGGRRGFDSGRGGGRGTEADNAADSARDDRRGKKGRKGREGKDADGAADGSKPSDKVHLFDFLGEKFPDAEEPTKESIANAAANSHNSSKKFHDRQPAHGDNNASSSGHRNNRDRGNEGGKGRDRGGDRRGDRDRGDRGDRDRGNNDSNRRNNDRDRGGGERGQLRNDRRDNEKPPRHQQREQQQQQDRSEKSRQNGNMKKWDLNERPPRADKPDRPEGKNERDPNSGGGRRGGDYRGGDDRHPDRGHPHQDNRSERQHHQDRPDRHPDRRHDRQADQGRPDHHRGGGEGGGRGGGRGGRRGGGHQGGGEGGRGQGQSDRDFGEWCNSTYHNATAQQQRNSGGPRDKGRDRDHGGHGASSISQQRHQHQQELLASMKNMSLNAADSAGGNQSNSRGHQHHQSNGYQQSQHSYPNGGYPPQGGNPPLPSSANQPQTHPQQHGRGQRGGGGPPPPVKGPSHQWQVGDDCLAKYWEDEKYYPVRVTAISKNNTAVVLFKEYGNHEEVFLDDIRPAGGAGAKNGGGFIPTTPGLPPAFPQTY